MTVVLVVDDEPAIRRSVSAGLAGRGYEVRTAVDRRGGGRRRSPRTRPTS